MNVAGVILSKVAPAAKKNYIDAFEDPANLLAQHEITTPLRIGHFLAQVMHETGGGKVLTENLNYTSKARLLQIFGAGRHSAAIQPEEAAGLLRHPEMLAERVYGLGNPKKARELGNLKPGDGYRYRGRGALQTTGGAHYRRASIASGIDFYSQPDLMVSSDRLLKPALDAWTEGHLNTAADRNDIRTITKTINGGYTGIAARQRWFETIWPIASGLEAPWKAAAGDDDTRRLQTALNDLGARPVLLVDGRYGPATTQAVKWFQALNDLKADGIAGDVTRAAIRLRLAAIRGGLD